MNLSSRSRISLDLARLFVQVNLGPLNLQSIRLQWLMVFLK